MPRDHEPDTHKQPLIHPVVILHFLSERGILGVAVNFIWPVNRGRFQLAEVSNRLR